MSQKRKKQEKSTQTKEESLCREKRSHREKDRTERRDCADDN
jgi:hypothetical protein